MEKDTAEFLRHMQEQLERYGHVLRQLSETLEREVPAENEKLKRAVGTAEVSKAEVEGDPKV